MKFLCEQCKAKYQIADDKVAGKTVRMKCRKCGHMIEVRAEVTETSVAKGLPNEEAKKAGAAAKAPPKSGLATSLTARPPSAPKGKPDALAGAFQKKVRADAESTSSLEILDSSTANGWYVAINGVPVGPIRISELRRKAANGAVTEDSLVWREGLEEWRPVRSVTELSEIVKEAITSGPRPSLVTPPPGEFRASAPPPAPAATSGSSSMAPRPPQRPAPAAPRAPEPRAPEPPRAAPLAARSNVVPFTGRLATAEKREEHEDIDIDEELEPISSSPSGALAAIAAPASSSPVLPSPLPERPSLVAADPFAPAAPAAARAPAAPTSTPAVAAAAALPASSSIALSPPVVVAEAPATKRAGLNPVAVGMVLAFMGFGVTAAVFIFKKDPPPPETKVIVQQIPVPTPQPGVATAPTGSGEVIELPDTTEKKPTGGGKVATGPKPTTQGNGNKLDLGGLLDGNNGPKVGGGGGGSTAAGGHRSEDSIQNTVRNYQLGVRRTCWERSGVQTPSVNITAKVSVDSSGHVSSVDASGNDPIVSKCIEQQVRNWNFGPGDSVTINIPFKFVRQ